MFTILAVYTLGVSIEADMILFPVLCDMVVVALIHQHKRSPRD